MRELSAKEITENVAEMCKEAAYYLPDDVYKGLKKGRETEESPVGRIVLDQIIRNAEIAREEDRPYCQDTGMTIVFVEVGQDLHITGGLLEDAINEGIAKGYTEGYLRKSVVEGVKNAVMEIIQHAGPNPCPPEVVGVGIGGTMDQAALLSKKALMRPIDQRHAMPEYAQLENELLEMINKTGIGPQLGGTTTALAVNIEWGATHIAGLPVAVTICCHALRHAHRVL